MLRGCSRYLDPHIYVQHGTENRCAKSTINTKKRNPGQKINVLKIHKNRHKNKIENWCTKKYPQNMSQKIRHKWPKINLQIGISSRCFLPKGPPSVPKGSPPPWGDWALFFGPPVPHPLFPTGNIPTEMGNFSPLSVKDPHPHEKLVHFGHFYQDEAEQPFQKCFVQEWKRSIFLCTFSNSLSFPLDSEMAFLMFACPPPFGDAPNL